MRYLKFIVIKLFFLFKVDIIVNRLNMLIQETSIHRINKSIQGNLRFVAQGEGGVTIAGDLSGFAIDATSHLKSNTYIECTGGVTIGTYFHTGRGLTIFSTNHNYEHGAKIPYDEVTLKKPVNIKDFVWCGANVTILPGVTVGEGAILAGGAVIGKDVPDYAVVGGNPMKLLKYRDKEQFDKLKQQGKFF